MGQIIKNGITYGGGGGSGATSLADLSDVNFTNLKAKDFLVHLNGNWVNKSKEELKLLTEDDELTNAQVSNLLALIN